MLRCRGGKGVIDNMFLVCCDRADRRVGSVGRGRCGGNVRKDRRCLLFV